MIDKSTSQSNCASVRNPISPSRSCGSWLLVVVVVCGLSEWATCQDLADQVAQQVIAWVGEQPIRRAQFDKELNRLIPQQFYHARIPKEERARLEQQALDALIEKSLILLWAKREGIEVSDSEILAEVRDVLAKAKPSERERYEGREAELASKYAKSIGERLRIAKARAHVRATVPTPTPEQMHQEFVLNGGRYRHPNRVKLSHLLISVDPSASGEEAKKLFELAKDLRTRIADGHSFESMARLYSGDIYAATGGDVGWITPEELRYRELSAKVGVAEIGQLSEVESTLHGYHLFRVEQREIGKPMTFPESKELVAANLLERFRVEKHEEWMTEMQADWPVRRLWTPRPTGDGNDPKRPESRPRGEN